MLVGQPSPRDAGRLLRRRELGSIPHRRHDLGPGRSSTRPAGRGRRPSPGAPLERRKTSHRADARPIAAKARRRQTESLALSPPPPARYARRSAQSLCPRPRLRRLTCADSRLARCNRGCAKSWRSESWQKLAERQLADDAFSLGVCARARTTPKAPGRGCLTIRLPVRPLALPQVERREATVVTKPQALRQQRTMMIAAAHHLPPLEADQRRQGELSLQAKKAACRGQKASFPLHSGAHWDTVTLNTMSQGSRKCRR